MTTEVMISGNDTLREGTRTEKAGRPTILTGMSGETPIGGSKKREKGRDRDSIGKEIKRAIWMKG